jgi:signal transduction histidine kinase/ligand-binding sensor domain-containing protein/CheY-like chemotaxis protein
MTINSIKWFILYSLLFFEITIEAQTNSILFTHITTEDGLSQNTVDDIFQDSRGFLWISTWNGLNVYDGYKFTKYFKSDNPESGLSSNVTHCCVEDKFGNIWIGTDKGISYYNINTSKFEHYSVLNNKLSSNNVLSLLIDSLGRMWIGHEKTGIDIATITETGILTVIKHFDMQTKPVSIANNAVFKFQVFDRESIWACTGNGLTRINKDFTDYENITPEKYSYIPFQSSRVYDLKFIDNFYWIATTNGLLKVNFNTKEAELYRTENSETHKLPHNQIKAIIQQNNNLLIGTRNGIAVLDLKTDEIYSYQKSSHLNNSLNCNFISCLFIDNQSNVWIGTEKGGMNKYNENQINFEYYIHNPLNSNSLNDNLVNSIIETDKWLIMSTDEGGVNVLNKSNKQFLHFTENNSSISDNTVSSLYLDSSNVLWLGTWGKGINKIHLKDIEKGNFNQIQKSTALRNCSTGKYISSITSDQYGNIWLGGYDGLCKIKPDQSIVEFSNTGIHKIGKMLFHTRNQLWLATQEGIVVLRDKDHKEIDTAHYEIFRYNSDTIENNTINGQYFISMNTDHEGNIWVGSYDNGVNKVIINPETALPDSFVHYSTNDGLPNNTIYSIEEDNSFNLWFSTDYGISKLNVSENQLVNFFTNDGLLSNQFQWTSSLKNEDGKLYFGSLKGVIAFYPDEVKERTAQLNIQLTEFKILGKTVYPSSENSPLKKHINKTDEITLKYAQNTFSFEFVTVNFYNSELYDYRYLLEGADKAWNDVENDLSAHYTKVEPGNYVFRVQFYELTNPSNISEKKVSILIKPPFYRTLGFKFGVVLISVLLILFVYKQRIKVYKRRNALLERKVKNRTFELEERNQQILEQNIEIKIQSEEILSKNEEINAQKDLLEDQKNKIELAYKELSNYKNQLEELVQERTRELIIAKDRAEESDRLKTSFLENLSHEIRTPLNAIIGFTNLSFNEDVNKDERIYFKNIVESSSNSLLDLITDILEISNLESGSLKLNKSKCFLEDIIAESKQIFNREILKFKKVTTENLKFTTPITDETSKLIFYSDYKRINQILAILINNAIKFTSEGQIELAANLVENKLLISIKDTGIGISEKNHKLIFERFRKADNDKNVMYRGAGIGLAIASKLSKLLGGEIWVESEYGKGAKFTFSLDYVPLKENTNLNKQSESATIKVDIPDLSGKIVIVAEDDNTNMAYLNRILIPTKAEILQATDGKEAVKLSNTHSVYLILMDIKMPEMSGYEALVQIKSKHPEIIVIAQTAYTLDEDLTKINTAGFDGYLSKPIAPSSLYITINHVIRRNGYS